jgi:hypothetical protein
MCYHQSTIMNAAGKGQAEYAAAGKGQAEYAAAGTIFLNRMLDDGRPHFIVLNHAADDFICAW